jgi:hypothetical protein
MSKKFVEIAAVLMVVAANAPGKVGVVVDPGPTAEENVKVAQNYSSRCSTNVGICYVPPAPVGSPCSCGNAPGTIVP